MKKPNDHSSLNDILYSSEMKDFVEACRKLEDTTPLDADQLEKEINERKKLLGLEGPLYTTEGMLPRMNRLHDPPGSGTILPLYRHGG